MTEDCYLIFFKPSHIPPLAVRVMRSLSRTRGTGVLSTVISAPESITLGVDQLTTVDELIELFHRDLLDQVGVFDDQGR
jgi:hypothetical protein